MRRIHPKTGYFVVEGLNAFAAVCYFNYLFFFMQEQHGFGNLGNLGLGAMSGLVYAAGAWQSGQLAQRCGYRFALKLGLVVMMAALLAGGLLPGQAEQVAVLLIWTAGICLTWPALEALVSEGEDSRGLVRMVGIYNLTWAAAAAVASFVGGALIEWLGARSLFFLPACIVGLELALVLALPEHPGRMPRRVGPREAPPEPTPAPEVRPADAALYLRLAWLANPLAYMAINTVIAMIPGLAQRYDLSPARAGAFSSIWFFARAAAFVALWWWTGWHYRFGWFLSALILLIGSFITLLTAPALGWVLAAQAFFGGSVGLIYYSSLYYSMDAGEAKGEHGGIHEAAIGIGLCAGPALGAGALWAFPARPNAGALAVGTLLAAGLFAVLGVRRRARRADRIRPCQR